MNITIKIIYQGAAAKIMQRGTFSVDQLEFSVDPDREAARIANVWLQQIKREGYVSEIIQVTYDEVNDITELMKELEKAPLE